MAGRKWAARVNRNSWGWPANLYTDLVNYFYAVGERAQRSTHWISKIVKQNPAGTIGNNECKYGCLFSHVAVVADDWDRFEVGGLSSDIG